MNREARRKKGKKNREKCISSQRTWEEDKDRARSLTSRAYSVHFSEHVLMHIGAFTSWCIRFVSEKTGSYLRHQTRLPPLRQWYIQFVCPLWYVKKEGFAFALSCQTLMLQSGVRPVKNVLVYNTNFKSVSVCACPLLSGRQAEQSEESGRNQARKLWGRLIYCH